MLLDNQNLFTLFMALFGHSLILFFAFFYGSRNQLTDYEEIQIQVPLRAARGSGSILKYTLAQFGALKPAHTPPAQVRRLFFCYLTVVPLLRYLSLAPTFFFVVSVLTYVAFVVDREMFAKEFNAAQLTNMSLVLGAALQFVYLFIKLVSGIPKHLQAQHPAYENAPALALFVDLYPTVTGYFRKK